MAIVLVITGPSGVGKGTLIAELRRRFPELEISVSATTRKTRPSEVDGVSYHFLTDREFDRRVSAGDFLESARYSGNRYGTLRSEVTSRLAAERSVVLEIEVEGARQVRDTMPEAVQVFIAPPRAESLRERLEARGTDSERSIEERLEVARRELESRHEFRHVVVNDDFGGAADRLAEIVGAALGRDR